MARTAALLCTLFLLAAGPAPAGDPGCSDPRAHDFDFWIGDWEVVNANGTVAGRNRIAPLLDGCVLQETWAGVSGSAGTSLNFYDTGRRQWRQFWVWREGTTLELAGGLVDGAMVMTGESVEDGRAVQNRITWSRRSGGRVNQRWETSGDGGKTWAVVFDGMYHPSK
jgi:hypothetical protein